MDVFNKCSCQQHFEGERWKIVMQEECALYEEVWQIVKQEAHQQHFTNCHKALPRLWNNTEISNIYLK